MLPFCITGTTAEEKPKQEPPNEAAPAEPEFEMLADGESPYPLADREDLSVNCGGGKGVLISPRWVLTAAHCITSRSQSAGKVSVNFPGKDGKKLNIGVEKVVRHASKDLALLLLHSPQAGDVLIGITHGSGRAPQVGWVANWIQESVQKHGADRLVWATKQQALGQ